MMRTLTCPGGHSFAADSHGPAVCPTCGVDVDANGSLPDASATFKPADELPPLPVPPATDTQNLAPFQLTGYEIIAELGRGGMGVVYQARQINLNRLVALKMLTSGIWGSHEEVARFKTEADALAQLQHPNIVQIHEVGIKDGRPYLALEFVAGGSLAKQLAGMPIDPGAAAQLIETLARAAHFAHQRLIVHRDLKPANILLEIGQDLPTDGASKTDLRAVIVKITDFGLAKRLDQDAGQTRTGAVMGTPSYMAPEQAAGKLDAIGPATDVYALGAILYELLTGRPPFCAVTSLDTVQQVLHDEPVAPRRLQSGVPFDLETICLKCLAKDPGRRYASAAALADDLARFLAGQPILARPVTWHERTRKWVRRRPALAGLIAASVVAVMLLAGLCVGLYYNALLHTSLEETEKQRTRADELARLNQRYRYLGQMSSAQVSWQENNVPRLLEVLEVHRAKGPDFRSFEWHYLSGLCRSELLTYAGHRHPVGCVSFSPSENLAASAGGRSTLGEKVGGIGEIHLWDPDSGQTRFILKGHTREVNALAFSLDGKLLASGDSDSKVYLWNVASGEHIAVLKGHAAAVTSVAFHPNGLWLASGSRDGTIKIWDVPAKKSLRDLVKHGAVVASIAFNHDGTRLIAGGFDPREGNKGEIWVWDPASAELVNAYRGHAGAVTSVLFHPDSKSFISAGEDRTIRIWNADNKEARVLDGHQDRVTSLALDKTGTRLASGSADLTALVWDIDSGKKLLARKGHTDAVRGVAFNRDGTRLLSASADRTVKIWNTEGQQEFTALAGHEKHVTDLVFSADNALLASAGEDHTVRLWDTATGKLRHILTGHQAPVRCLAFAKDGKSWHLLSAGDDGAVRFWDKEKEVFHLDVPGQQIHAAALTPDGAHVAVAGVSNGDFQAPADITLWNIEQKKLIRTFAGHARRITTLAFSPDGKRLVSAGADALKIWDVAARSELASIALPDATEPRVVWSRDGKRLALANGDVDKGTIRILDADTGKEQLPLKAHAGMAKALAFTPDGERLVTTTGKRTAACQIKLFDVVTGQEVITLPGPTGLVRCLAISPDGRHLAAGGGSLSLERGEVVLWHGAAAR